MKTKILKLLSLIIPIVIIVLLFIPMLQFTRVLSGPDLSGNIITRKEVINCSIYQIAGLWIVIPIIIICACYITLIILDFLKPLNFPTTTFVSCLILLLIVFFLGLLSCYVIFEPKF